MTRRYTIITNLTISPQLIGKETNNTKTIEQQLLANITNNLYLPINNHWDKNIKTDIQPHFDKELKRINKIKNKIKNKQIGVDKAYSNIKTKPYNLGEVEVVFISDNKEIHNRLLEITANEVWEGILEIIPKIDIEIYKDNKLIFPIVENTN